MPAPACAIPFIDILKTLLLFFRNKPFHFDSHRVRAPLALLAGPVHAGAQAQVAADQRLQIGRRRQLAVSLSNAFHPGFYQTPQVISLTLLTLVFLIDCTPHTSHLAAFSSARKNVGNVVFDSLVTSSRSVHSSQFERRNAFVICF